MRLKNIFCVLNILVGIFICFPSYCQVKQINTGSNATLLDLSVINENIMISGWYDYLVKSNDGCDNLTPLAIPGATGTITRLLRLDTSNIFLLSYTPNGTYFFKSIDGGYNWIKKLDSTGNFSSYIGFFDPMEGIVSFMSNFIRTKDGGDTWVTGSMPLVFPESISSIKTYADSMVCLGSDDGNFFLSKDRGNTWPYAWGISGGQGAYAIDFSFVNKDTIFGISSTGIFGGSYYTKTTDGGNNWKNFPNPIYSANSIYFKKTDEGYILGADILGYGIISKTNDLGQTWSTFNTGIKTQLINIAFLNDSIALLTGTNGVLLRWNYKSTVFTGISENYLDNAGLKIFPNPIKDKLSFEFSSSTSEILKLNISNTLGQSVYSKENFDLKEELDVSFLKAGIYYLTLRQAQGESEKGYKVFKVIKE